MGFVRVLLLGLLVTLSNASFCSYFGNREPGREPGLTRCTDYRGSSCCQPDEEDIGFNVDPIFNGGESSNCRRTVNLLRCWICHPQQNLFYKNETLTLCEGMCDRLLRDCGGAAWRDGRVYNYYRNGNEICKEMGFNVASTNCFTSGMASGARRTAAFTSKLATLITLLGGFLLTGLLTKSTQFNTILICITVTVVLMANSANAQTNERAQEVTGWANRVSSFITELARDHLLVDEAQALFDNAEYNEVSVNGSEIVGHIRQRLSTFAADKLRALDNMVNAITNAYNQFYRNATELPYRNPEDFPSSIYRDSDASDHLPYDRLTFDRLVLI